MESRTSNAVLDLEARLNTLKTALLRTTFLGGASFAVWLGCLCLAGAFLVDLLWDAPHFLRVGFLLATLSAVAAMVVLRVVRPLCRRVSHEELAALVESAH